VTAPRCFRIFLAGALFLLAARLPFGQAKPAKSALPKVAADTVQLMVDWERRSSPGAKVEARELKRTPGDDGTAVTYRFVVTGLPADKLYTLMAWEPVTELADAAPVTYSLRLTPAGMVCGMAGNCATRCVVGMNCGILGEAADPVVVAAKGERKFFALLSNDGKSGAFFAVTPFPITASDKNCSLNVTRAVRSTLAVVQGSGFLPVEDVAISTSSYDVQDNSTMRADSQGHFSFAVFPFVAGKKNGVTRFQAKGKQCAPTVEFDWGADAMKLQ